MESVWTTGKRFWQSTSFFRFITNTFEGILHSAAPSATGAVPVHGSTGTPVARNQERIVSTIPNADVCRKAVDHELLFASGYSTEFCVGQQRQQILELQFDKFPTPSTFSRWKIRFKNQVTTCSDFPSEAMLWSKEVEMVDSVDEF